MKSYTGHKDISGMKHVFVLNEGVKTPLDPGPAHELYPHSPGYFNWSDLSPGAALLSLAILLDLIGRKPALAYYQLFKFDIVSKFKSKFCISGGEVKAWLKQSQDL